MSFEIHTRDFFDSPDSETGQHASSHDGWWRVASAVLVGGILIGLAFILPL